MSTCHACGAHLSGLPYCLSCGTSEVGFVSSERGRKTAWRAASTEGCAATAASFVFFVACVALAVLA